jgi:hypothetical protein
MAAPGTAPAYERSRHRRKKIEMLFAHLKRILRLSRLRLRGPSGARDRLRFGGHGYCSDFRCSHSTAISGDRWPDQVRLSDLEARFVCRACGTRGADVRPDFNWDKRPDRSVRS